MTGSGVLKTAWVENRTAIVRAQANNPLKFLCPRSGNVARVYTTTFGGGLVAGDQIELDVHIDDHTTCLLTTQASTKIYKCPPGQVARQTLTASVGSEALLAVVPDPVTCFAHANYEQRQCLKVADGGNLVFVDWLTSGRRAREECWDFSRYHSQTEIFYDNKQVFIDSLLLDPTAGPLTSPFRLGHYHCVALFVILGNYYKNQINSILQDIAQQPLSPGSAVIESASKIAGGLVGRCLGQETEPVQQVLKTRLEFLTDRLGNGPWSRKW